MFGTDGALTATGQTRGIPAGRRAEWPVWGVYQDELEIQSVRAYEIAKR